MGRLAAVHGAAVFSLGGMAAGIEHNAQAKVIAAVGGFYARQIGHTGGGLEAIATGAGAAEVPGALVGTRVASKALPVLGGVLGIVQGVGAVGDLLQYVARHDVRGAAHDLLLVGGGAVGIAVVGAVIIGTAPADLAVLGVAGAGLAIASAIV